MIQSDDALATEMLSDNGMSILNMERKSVRRSFPIVKQAEPLDLHVIGYSHEGRSGREKQELPKAAVYSVQSETKMVRAGNGLSLGATLAHRPMS